MALASTGQSQAKVKELLDEIEREWPAAQSVDTALDPPLNQRSEVASHCSDLRGHFLAQAMIGRGLAHYRGRSRELLRFRSFANCSQPGPSHITSPARYFVDRERLSGRRSLYGAVARWTRSGLSDVRCEPVACGTGRRRRRQSARRMGSVFGRRLVNYRNGLAIKVGNISI